MEGKKLAAWQAKVIYSALWPALNYTFRLQARMEKVGFLPNDPLYLLVARAYEALHRLTVRLHYESCKGGVGKPPKEK